MRYRAARRLLSAALLVLVATVSSACDIGTGPGPINLFGEGPGANDREYASQTADGDWNVHLSNGRDCLVFARDASNAQRALEVCRARVG